MTYVKTFDLHFVKIKYMKDLPYIDVLKQIMAEKKLSQQKIADLLGVNQTTVSQWLLGKKKPGYDSIVAIYEHFFITPNELFGIEEY